MKRGLCLALLIGVIVSPASSQDITTEGNIETDGQLVSNVATGTAPLAVSSTTLVPSLNADQVDGIEGTALALDADLQSAEAMLLALQAQVDALGLALVPRTGQTTCHDVDGTVIACGTGIGLGQDGDLQLGVTWPNPRFTVNESSPGVSDGTVTDNLTGLIWLQDASCGNLAGTNGNGSGLWSTALSAPNTLASGTCGLTDDSTAGQWRLPNVRELQSLAHYGGFNPAVPNTAGTGPWVEGDPFFGVEWVTYWSSTTDANGLTNAWGVRFASGSVVLRAKDTVSAFIWPVRGGS